MNESKQQKKKKEKTTKKKLENITQHTHTLPF